MRSIVWMCATMCSTRLCKETHVKQLSRMAVLFLCTARLGGVANAQGENPTAAGSPLSGLARPHAGTAKHEGSWDRSGGNGDLRPVDPGQTITLLDVTGAGVIHRFW